MAKKHKGNQVKQATKSDHFLPSHVFDLGTVQVYAGSNDARQMATSFQWDLIINLTGRRVPYSAIAFDHLPEWAQITPKPQPELVVAWPDYGVPTLPASYWRELFTAMQSNIKGKVLIHCEKGRGRTGTLLAVLLGLTKPFESLDYCRWVRDNYDHRAIETVDQLDYFEITTGLSTKETAGWGAVYTGPVAGPKPGVAAQPGAWLKPATVTPAKPVVAKPATAVSQPPKPKAATPAPLPPASMTSGRYLWSPLDVMEALEQAHWSTQQAEEIVEDLKFYTDYNDDGEDW